jgi:hypothetical protein
MGTGVHVLRLGSLNLGILVIVSALGMLKIWGMASGNCTRAWDDEDMGCALASIGNCIRARDHRLCALRYDTCICARDLEGSVSCLDLCCFWTYLLSLGITFALDFALGTVLRLGL